jgi:glycosyltransferase involved in cell wall biosynthesis
MNVILKGQLAFINNHYEVICATSPFANYFDEVEKREGVRVFSVPFTRTVNPLTDLIALYKLLVLIITERPDVVHTQTPKANLIGMLAAIMGGVKFRMVSIVGMPVININTTKGKAIWLLESLSFRIANRLYPNSFGLLDFYSNSFKKEKLKVIGNGSSNGVDFNFFSRNKLNETDLGDLKKTLGIKDSDLVFVFLGRMVNDKGICELVDSFEQVEELRAKESVKLLLVGPFRDSDNPIPAAYKKRIQDNTSIITVGLQKDVRPFLAIANVFVFPSYREGLPGSLLQAAAMELPILASDIVGNKEIIENVGGLLFKKGDVKTLKKVMLLLIDDIDLRIMLCKEVREKAKNLYSQEVYWQSLLAEYKWIEKQLYKN